MWKLISVWEDVAKAGKYNQSLFFIFVISWSDFERTRFTGFLDWNLILLKYIIISILLHHHTVYFLHKEVDRYSLYQLLFTPPPINSVNIHAKKNNNTGSKHTHNTLWHGGRVTNRTYRMVHKKGSWVVNEVAKIRFLFSQKNSLHSALKLNILLIPLQSSSF